MHPRSTRALSLVAALGAGCLLASCSSTSPSSSTTTTTSGSTPPIANESVWHTGVATSICGTWVEPFTASTNEQVPDGLTSLGNGVVVVAPTSSVDAGSNATLNQFINEWSTNRDVVNYVLSPGSLTVGFSGYSNGTTCPSGTPDAGQAGVVRIGIFDSPTAAAAGKYHVETDPSKVLLKDHQFVVVAFNPSSQPIPSPKASLVAATLVGGAPSRVPAKPTPGR